MDKGERNSSGDGDALCCTLKLRTFGTKLKTAIFGRPTIWSIYYLKDVIDGIPLAKRFVFRLGKCMLFTVLPQLFPLKVILAGRER